MGEITVILCSRESKQRRKGASKSRNGCVTCKVRRIKCDETRPACDRCTSTHRRCDFLSPTSEVPKWTPAKVPKRLKALSPPQPKSFALLPKISATPCISIPSGEVHHFDYFRLLSTTSFSRYFECSLWDSTVLQISHSEPSIRSAIIVIGAILRGQISHTESSNSQDETTAYLHAVHVLNNRLDDSKDSWELAILASLLFTTIEMLAGRDQTAVKHFEAGLALLKQYYIKFPHPSTLITQITKQFHRFDIQASSYAVFYHSPFPVIPHVPSSFQTMEEAREALENIVAYSYQNLKPYGEKHCTLPYTPLPSPLVERLEQITTLLTSWPQALENSSLGVNESDETAVKVLKVQHLACTIQVQTHFYRDELAFDAFMPQFTEIIRLAEAALPAGDEPAFMFDMGVIQPLYIVACKCRQGVLRRKAIELLERAGMEGVWGGRAMAAAARWAVGVEEGGAGEWGLTISTSGKTGLVSEATTMSVVTEDQFVPESRRLREVGISMWRAGRRMHLVSTQRTKGEDGKLETRYVKKNIGWGTQGEQCREWTKEEEDEEWWIGNWKRYLEGEMPLKRREGEVVNHPLAM